MMSEWTRRTLGELLRFYNGKSIKPGGIGDAPVFGSNGLIGGTEEALYSQGIIIGRVGAYCGSVALSRVPFWASDNTIVAVPEEGHVELRFAYYLLKYMNLNRWAGGAAQPLLTQTVLKQLAIDVPAVRLQSRIADVLSAYDDLIENNTKRVKILEEMARSLYREWFVHFRFPGYERMKLVNSMLGAVPEGWTVRMVSEYGQIVTGKTPSKTDPANFGADVPFIKLPDMHGQIFCLQTAEMLSVKGASCQANKTIPPNSVCVSCIGTAGVVCITSLSSQTNQQINSIVPMDSFAREFVFFTVQGLGEHLRRLGANGATMVNVNKEKFASIHTMWPGAMLVRRFHELAAPCFDQILNLQRANIRLRAARDLLLPRLISGEIDVSSMPLPPAA